MVVVFFDWCSVTAVAPFRTCLRLGLEIALHCLNLRRLQESVQYRCRDNLSAPIAPTWGNRDLLAQTGPNSGPPWSPKFKGKVNPYDLGPKRGEINVWLVFSRCFGPCRHLGNDGLIFLDFWFWTIFWHRVLRPLSTFFFLAIFPNLAKGSSNYPAYCGKC